MARHASQARADYRGAAIAGASAAARAVNLGIVTLVPCAVVLEFLAQFRERLPQIEDYLRAMSGVADLALVALLVALAVAVHLGLVGLGLVLGSRLTAWKVALGLILAWVALPATWLGWRLAVQGHESLWLFAPTYVTVGYLLGVLRTAPESIKVKWIVEDVVNEQTRLVEDLGEEFSWVAAHLDLARPETRNELRQPRVVRPPDFEVFGMAGITLLSGVGKGLNRRAVWQGIKGEKLTTDIIRDVAGEYPGLTLIQNLKVPGSDTWDVDHAVVYGNRVILIDSKFYRNGTYAWVGDHIEDYERNGRFSMPNSHAKAARVVAGHLPPDTEVVAMIAIHSSDGGLVETFNAGDAKPLLVNAADTARVIRSLLQGQNLSPAGPVQGAPARRHQRLVTLLAGNQERTEGPGVRPRPGRPEAGPRPGREDGAEGPLA